MCGSAYARDIEVSVSVGVQPIASDLVAGIMSVRLERGGERRGCRYIGEKRREKESEESNIVTREVHLKFLDF